MARKPRTTTPLEEVTDLTNAANRELAYTADRLRQQAELVADRARRVADRAAAIAKLGAAALSSAGHDGYTGLNELGELQGASVEFDRLVAVLSEKARVHAAFRRLLVKLGEDAS